MRKCIRCAKKRADRYYSGPKARICSRCKTKERRIAARAIHLRKTFDISLDEYNRMLDDQNGACWICGGVRRYSLAVDHDHATAKNMHIRQSIRGLLCKRCNKLLSMVRDNPDILERAVLYLSKRPAQEVLEDRTIG